MKRVARFLYRIVIFFGPDPDAAECFAESTAEIGEGVVDVRGNNGVDGPYDEAVAFHLADGFGEHLLADAAGEFAELGEANGAVVGEDIEDNHGPLIGDAFDDFVDEGIDLGI